MINLHRYFPLHDDENNCDDNEDSSGKDSGVHVLVGATFPGIRFLVLTLISSLAKLISVCFTELAAIPA